jgi:hypothetical protein
MSPLKRGFVIKKVLVIALALAILNASPVWAVGYRVPGPEQTYRPQEWDQEKLYIDRAFGKLTFGAWNFMLGWMQLFRKPYEAMSLDDSLLIGTAKGIAYAVIDTAGGALNLITFPITALKIPLPEGGVEAREF